MVALAAPIAIFVNALRVAVLGWLHLIDPALAHGDFHLFVGMLMLIPAAGLLMFVGWCLDKAIIVEGPPAKPPAPLPFDDDPNQIHFDKPVIAKGAGLGAAVVVTLGLSYILLINRMTDHAVIDWLGAGLNAVALGLSSVLFVAALGWAWLSIRKGAKGQRLMLSQGVVAGVLLAAAAGQTSAINSMGIALTKKPLPLRHSIALAFPEKTGNWELLHQDPALPKDIADELGTDDYFNRYYVNTDKVATADVTPKLNEEGRLSAWPGVTLPGQLAKVHVAYYTGMLDTVPHVPDKCWVVAGQQVVYREQHTLKLSRPDYKPDPEHPGMVLAHSEGQDETVRLPSDEIEAVVFSGADENGNTTTALYFFLANGDAIASSHQVRFSFNLKDRYSYYCKVEVMFPGISDPDIVAEHAEELLSDLLPDIMAALPDWTEVQAGTYPESRGDGAKKK
jgi:hypothetical protein